MESSFLSGTSELIIRVAFIPKRCRICRNAKPRYSIFHEWKCINGSLLLICSKFTNNNRDTLSDTPKKNIAQECKLERYFTYYLFLQKVRCFLFLPLFLILLIFAVFLSCKFIVFARECFVSFHVNIAIYAVVVRAGVNTVFIV